MYLAIVLTLFNRDEIAWSFKPRMTSATVTDALAMAWFYRRPASAVMHHSVRGRKYASKVFQGKLKEFDVTCFMGRKGNCADNAPTGSWPNSFKSKRYHDHRYVTHVDMKTVRFKYIDVFYI